MTVPEEFVTWHFLVLPVSAVKVHWGVWFRPGDAGAAVNVGLAGGVVSSV